MEYYQRSGKSYADPLYWTLHYLFAYPFWAHTGPLMYANKMLSVNSINTYLMGIIMFQCIHQDVPEIFLNLFQTNDDVHDYNTRRSQKLHVPHGRLDVRGFNFKVHGAHAWNTKPDHIKNVQTIHTFKQLLCNYILECNWFCAFATGCYNGL